MKLAKSDRGWMSGVVGDDVVTIGDPRLKAETQAIDDVHDAAELLARMVNRLRELNGAGLAAPQLGASVKVIVVEVRKTDVFPDHHRRLHLSGGYRCHGAVLRVCGQGDPTRDRPPQRRRVR